MLKIRKIISLMSALILLTGIIAISNLNAAYTYPFQDPSLTVEERINDLLPRMTLDEKAGQMIQGERASVTAADVKNYFLGSVLNGGGSVPSPNTPTGWCDMIDAYQTQAMATRLQIPFIYGSDAVHGHNNVFGATIFPHNIGMGATRDTNLSLRMGQIVANEVRATGVHWSFAPCIAVPQNEKWGRTYEGFSEDTDLVGQMGVAYVQGLQGANYPADLKLNDKAVSCIKHYIGDGATDGGVNAGNATMTDTVMRQKYLPPYITSINAGARTVMISFNTINGLECHENYHIITEILKNELGFTGFTVSDWDGINDNNANYRTAVKEAVNAGLDMIMVPTRWKECLTNIKDLVNTGEVSQARIDDAVRRILRVKFQMGLFEKPYADRTLMSSFGSAAHRDVAREAVRKSLVLLKNNNNILPLAKSGKKIFVAGKCADNIGNQCGGWTMTWQGGSGNITTGTSILQGIRNVATGDTVTFSQTGTGAAGNDVAIVVIGETPYAEGNGDNQTLALDSTDITALNNVKNSGVPMVVVLVSGRPMIVTSQLPDWAAFVAAWLPGTEGQGVAEVLFGNYNFTGKLPMVWPQSASQIPISPNDGQTPLYAYGTGLVYGALPTPTPSPIPTPTLTPTASPGGNRALNKPATASSTEAAGYEAAKAVDGNTTTRWSSAFSDPQWIYVDLGTNYTVNRVKLNWEAAYGRSYKIQVSNNASAWTDVYSTTTGDGGIDDLTFTATSARYVRMYGTQRSTTYGYSLFEFEVYDQTGPTQTSSPAPSPTPTPTPSAVPGVVWYQNFEASNGFSAGTSATVAIDNSSANTGGTKSVKMTITASGDPGTTTKCVKVTPQAGATLNVTGKNYFIFFIRDTQGANTHRVTIVDSANATWSGWTTVKSVQNVWTRITLPMSSVTGVNLAAIKEIRLGEWNAGTYYFDDLFFGANATDPIPVF